ncbi:MAG: membrane-associated phospholipid phosphatase, partial [Myxococcota bacterium]
AGILGQAALMGYASWIGVTRIEDNRHHTSDVVVGALVGAGIASLVYFANYQSNGRPRFGESGSSPSQVAAPITVSFGGAF